MNSRIAEAMVCHRCRTPFRCHNFASSPRVGLSIRRGQMRLSSSLPSGEVASPPAAPRPVAPGFGSVAIPSTIPPASASISEPLSTAEHILPAVSHDETTKPTMGHKPSSLPAGARLQGLNYTKNKPDIFAMEDSDYPDWLWGLLDSSKQSLIETGGVDVRSTASL
jgi:large subunit ribosomal protein L54